MCFDRSWLTCIYAINQTVLAKTMITPLALPKIVHLLQNKLTHYSEDTGAFIVASLFHSTKTTEATRLHLSPQHKFFIHDPKVNKLSHHNLSNKHKCKHGHWTWSTSIIKKSKTRREGLYYSVQRLQNGVHSNNWRGSLSYKKAWNLMLFMDSVIFISMVRWESCKVLSDSINTSDENKLERRNITVTNITGCSRNALEENFDVAHKCKCNKWHLHHIKFLNHYFTYII